jgi:hypothetical protein
VRNYFAIAFTCVYLILTVGVAKTTHYCMGRLNHSSLFSFQTEKCPCALFEKDASRSCCKDERVVIVIDNDQNPGAITSLHVPEFFALGFSVSDFVSQPVAAPVHRGALIVSDTAPPGRGPLFKLHCSFVFYG